MTLYYLFNRLEMSNVASVKGARLTNQGVGFENVTTLLQTLRSLSFNLCLKTQCGLTRATKNHQDNDVKGEVWGGGRIISTGALQ